MSRKSETQNQSYIHNSPLTPVEVALVGEGTTDATAQNGQAQAAAKGARFVAAPFNIDGAAAIVAPVTTSPTVTAAADGSVSDLLASAAWNDVQGLVSDAAAAPAADLPDAVAEVAALAAVPFAVPSASTLEAAGVSAFDAAPSSDLFASAVAADSGNDGLGNASAPGGGVGGGSVGATAGGNGNGGAGNANAPGGGVGGGNGGATGGGSGNGGLGNPNAPGGGTGEGNQGATGGGNGNQGAGNPDAPGDGGGDGNQGGTGGGNGDGGGDGISDKPAPAPTPPDVLVQDRETADFISTYRFSMNDVTGDFDGNTFGTDTSGAPPIINFDKTMETKSGVTLYGVDSEFGFHVSDFLGAEQKERDGDYGEGWIGELPDGEGVMVANARTVVFSTPARLGTWLEGIGGNTVKASTEHYSVMQEILSDQGFPGDTSGYYQLDDDLWIIDYKTNPDQTPDLDENGQLQQDVMHGFHVDRLLDALEDAEGRDISDLSKFMNFDKDPRTPMTEYKAYMTDIEIDGVTRNVAAVDIGADGVIDYYDRGLNGFGTYGLADILVPNESTVIADIAVSDDYSVTLKDDGKLLYRWGNAVKRPNDMRLDAKMELPDEWTDEATYVDGDGVEQTLPGLKALWHVTAAELVVNHTVTNNPNDQIRPEDFENEAAIGQLPDYVEVRDPFDADNVLWVSPHNMFAGDGSFYASYFVLDENGEIDMGAGGTEVRFADGTIAGYLNEDAYGNAIGTVYRDFSLIDAVATSTLAEIGAMSSDLVDGFTKEWYTTMDREPFQAVLNEDGEYEIGPRWRLQPDKYGQDLPSVTIPQDPSDPPPIQNGEEKYESGADTTTVLNLLDWDGTSPLTLSAGWQTGDGTVSDNGLNMTEAFDVAYYVKGDMKPVSLYDAELVLSYEEVEITGVGLSVEGTSGADVLAGLGNNFFHLGIGDGASDLIVLSYGADIGADVWALNRVEGFAKGEDALGLIGFELDPDNYNIHLTQEVNAEDDLEVSYDDIHVATLEGVTDFLEADDFYFA